MQCMELCIPGGADQLNKWQVKPPAGLLLYGPSGTGEHLQLQPLSIHLLCRQTVVYAACSRRMWCQADASANGALRHCSGNYRAAATGEIRSTAVSCCSCCAQSVWCFQLSVS